MKFVITAKPGTVELLELLQNMYEIYSDFVLKVMLLNAAPSYVDDASSACFLLTSLSIILLLESILWSGDADTMRSIQSTSGQADAEDHNECSDQEAPDVVVAAAAASQSTVTCVCWQNEHPQSYLSIIDWLQTPWLVMLSFHSLLLQCIKCQWFLNKDTYMPLLTKYGACRSILTIRYSCACMHD